LRQSLIFGGLETIKRNINHKRFDLKFFEFGKEYILDRPTEIAVDKKYSESAHLGIFISGKEVNEGWKTATSESDFYTLKLILTQLFQRFGIDTMQMNISESESANFAFGLEYAFQQKPIASIGKLSKMVMHGFDIEQDVFFIDVQFDNFLAILNRFKTKFSEIPKFPAVRRDLALLVDKSIDYSAIESIIRKVDKNLLKAVNLFDVYVGKGIASDKKSYAISLIFQDESKTLTDKIIDKTVGKMVYVLEKEIGAKLR
jgi:phenylalanyl-tRNA synthetase beta chain